MKFIIRQIFRKQKGEYKNCDFSFKNKKAVQNNLFQTAKNVLKKSKQA